jgi:hypothetical protein
VAGWNALVLEPGGCFLLNPAGTAVRFSRRASRIDFVGLLVRMEELDVPFAYTRELAEIYFTVLPGGKLGDYLDGQIRLSCGVDGIGVMDRTLVHELAHHVDELEELSERSSIVSEKRARAKFMSDVYSRTDVGEYVAVGFEVFYLGTPEQRSKMRTCNGRLYDAISRVHRKYRSL